MSETSSSPKYLCDVCGLQKEDYTVVMSENLAGVVMCSDCHPPKPVEKERTETFDDFMERLAASQATFDEVAREYYWQGKELRQAIARFNNLWMIMDDERPAREIKKKFSEYEEAELKRRAKAL